MLRIHNILMWIRIRIRGSMPLTNRSGFGYRSCYFHWQKLIFLKCFSEYYFLKVHLHHFSKIKSKKKSPNSRTQGLSYYFFLMIKGSGSIPLANGSGSGSRRPKTCGSGGTGSGFGPVSAILVSSLFTESHDRTYRPTFFLFILLVPVLLVKRCKLLQVLLWWLCSQGLVRSTIPTLPWLCSWEK